MRASCRNTRTMSFRASGFPRVILPIHHGRPKRGGHAPCPCSGHRHRCSRCAVIERKYTRLIAPVAEPHQLMRAAKPPACACECACSLSAYVCISMPQHSAGERLFMRARWLVAHRLRKDASVTLDGARDGGDRVRARTCPRAQTSHTRARAR